MRKQTSSGRGLEGAAAEHWKNGKNLIDVKHKLKCEYECQNNQTTNLVKKSLFGYILKSERAQKLNGEELGGYGPYWTHRR